jgi:hypothetical protein
MNHDDFGLFRHARESIRDRILTAGAAIDDSNGLLCRFQKGWRRGRQLGWECDNDFVDTGVCFDGVEGTLENRAVANDQQLLQRGRAEPRSPTSSRNDGGDEHDDRIICWSRSSMVGGRVDAGADDFFNACRQVARVIHGSVRLQPDRDCGSVRL